MASIRTVFTLTDNVSPALQKIDNNAKLVDKSFNNLVRALVAVSSTIAILSNIGNIISRNLGRINALVKEYEDAISAETRLITILRQRMNATEEMIGSVQRLNSELQSVGIYSADMLTYGAQELATYVESTDALNKLIPAMADLVAQRAGYTATNNDMVASATMIGKVMIGQVNAMTRVGYYFSEAEKQLLTYGNEEQRVAVLTDVITRNVGKMNTALAKTEIGQIMQLSNQINDIRESVGGLFTPLKRGFLQLKLIIYSNLQEPVERAVKVIRANMKQILTTVSIVATGVVAYALIMASAWALANLPITVVITSLVLFGTVLNNLGLLTGNTLQVIVWFVGIFVGAITSAFNTVYNVIASVYNAFVDLGEIFFYLSQALEHPVKFIQTVFIKLASIIATALSPITSIIDTVFGTNLTKATKDTIANLEKAKQDIWSDTGVETNTNLTVGRKLELKTIQETSPHKMAEIAYEGAGTFTDWLESTFTNNEHNWGTLLGGGGNVQVTDSTNLLIVDELKDLLARRALDKYIISVSQVTPRMTISNIEIKETADANKIITMIADGYENMVNSYLGE